MSNDLHNKSILLVSPEPWHHIFVSKHHYAIHLAQRGNQVFFLNPPSSFLKLKKSDHQRLCIIDYKGFPKGLRFFPGFFRKYFVRKAFEELEHLAQVEFNIIWSFDNSVFFDFDALPDTTLKISHIVDLNQDFQTQRAASTADICMGVFPQLVNRLREYNAKSYLVRHGVSIHPIAQKVKLPGNGRFKALYFGNLSMPDLNWELLRDASEIRKDIDFVLMGSNHQSVPNGMPVNVFLLPAVPSQDLGSYMAAADILFLFYHKSYNHHYASPHKMMEYLSSGKPIVTTYLSDYESEDCIYMGSEDSWLELIEEAILENQSPSSEEKAAKRKSIALENTYEKQIDKIGSLLSNN